MNTRRLILAAAACAALGLGTVGAVAQEDDGPPSAPGDDVAQVTDVEPAAESAAAVLEQERVSSDALPAEVADAFDAEPMFGMNPDLSRLAIGSVSSSLYVVPANGHVCTALTFGEAAAVSCPETSDLAAGEAGAATTVLEGGAIAVYGIVPDGVEEVTVHSDAPGSGVVEVVDNGYLAAVPAGTVLDSVGYTGPSGAVSFPVSDPEAP